MTLWYKAWRESRTRFIVTAAVLAAMCLAVVLFSGTLANLSISRTSVLPPFPEYIYSWVYRGKVRGMFLLFAIILGLGGLERERAHHTAAFTLSLPVSRTELVISRAVLGFIEVALLAAIPAIAIPAASPFVHKAYAWQQALQFSILWTLCGGLCFAAAFCISVVLKSEYTALTASFAAVFVYPICTAAPGLRSPSLNIHYIMSGHHMPYFNPATNLLIGPFPWTIAATILVIAAGFFAVAAQATRRQDFS